jgi:VWFA-related protein
LYRGATTPVDSSAPPDAKTGTQPKAAPDATTPQRGPGPLNFSTRFGGLAFVYDRLSPNARSIAREASLSYIDGMQRDDFAGVFGIDLSLHVLQRFTNNGEKIKAAVDRALGHSSSTYSSVVDKIADLQNEQSGLQTQIDTGQIGAGAGNDPSGAIGAAAAQQQFNAMTLNIAQGFERMEHNQQGYATIDGLLAIIEGMKNLPGRKAMIFFSEGITLPTNVMSHFRSVISSANRANVSIYAVDAAARA